MSREILIQLVVSHAVAKADQLPVAQRADLFEGVGVILGDTPEGEHARETAFMLRQADKLQMTFLRRLQSPLNSEAPSK